MEQNEFMPIFQRAFRSPSGLLRAVFSDEVGLYCNLKVAEECPLKNGDCEGVKGATAKPPCRLVRRNLLASEQTCRMEQNEFMPNFQGLCGRPWTLRMHYL